MSISLQLIKIPEGENVASRSCFATEMPFVIGREFDCDLVLPDISAKLSRRHIEILVDKEGRYRVTDQSTNGTNLNGTQIEKGSPTVLSDGDILGVGDYEILLGIVEEQAETEKEPERAKSDKAEEAAEFKDIEAFGDSGLIDPFAEVEAVVADVPRGFDDSVEDLAANLLFDPFADGPDMNEEAGATKVETVEVEPLDQPMSGKLGGSAAFDRVNLDAQTSMAPRHSNWMMPERREEGLLAVEAAITRFLDQLDPEKLEEEYNDFMGFFSNRRRRYWTIHKKNFARKKDNGDYVRMFKALLAEELRKR